jgi:uncharacterized protein (DUF2236 family)
VASVPLSRRINAERLMLLAWSRAILLQLAHPLIATGVAEHSAFREGPTAAARRLHHVVRAMLALTFGDPDKQRAAIAGINRIHKSVNGQLRQTLGRFPAGTRYSAEDPDLVLWVHATLVESVVLAYDAIVAPLDTRERDRYCEEAVWVPVALGARDADVPRTWSDMMRYVEEVHASGALFVGDMARELASAVLSPPFAFLGGPLTWANRLITRGLLPPSIRAAYGFKWSPADDRHLASVLRTLHAVRRWSPRAIVLWPEARATAGAVTT